MENHAVMRTAGQNTVCSFLELSKEPDTYICQHCFVLGYFPVAVEALRCAYRPSEDDCHNVLKVHRFISQYGTGRSWGAEPRRLKKNHSMFDVLCFTTPPCVTLTRLRDERSGFDCRQGQEGFLFSRKSRPVLVPTQPRVHWVPAPPLPRGWSGWDMKSTTGYRLAPRLRMSGVVPRLPLYAVMVRVAENCLFHLVWYLPWTPVTNSLHTVRLLLHFLFWQ